jgi:hypothetical protein
MKPADLCFDIDVSWRPGDGERIREFFLELLEARRGQVRKVVKQLRRWREQHRTRQANVLETGSFALDTIVRALPESGLDICSYATSLPIQAARSTAPPAHMPPDRLSLSVYASLYRAWDLADLIITMWSSRAVVRPGKPKKTFLPTLVDRVRSALLRVVSGFFGPRKVDSRNNP